MKKIGILVILALAIGVGVFSYTAVVKDTTNNSSQNSNQNANTQSSSNTTNVSNNTSQQPQTEEPSVAPSKQVIHHHAATDAKIETTHTSNSSSSNTQNYNQLFAYNFGVNIFYNENINPTYKAFEPTLTEKFKAIYGNKKNVIIKVSDIYLTSNNGHKQAVALYHAQYEKQTSNGATEYYTAPNEMISVNVNASSSYHNTALFPEQLNRTSISTTIDGINFKSETPYITYTQNGVSQTIYFAHVNLNTNTSSALTVYPTINNAKTKTNAITLNTAGCYVNYILDGYVYLYDYQNQKSGYMKFDSNVMQIEANDFLPEGQVNPRFDYPYSNSPTYLNDVQTSSYKLYAVPTSESPIIGTVSSKDIVRVMRNSNSAYTLVGVHGILAYIKTSALLENAPTIPTVKKVVYPKALDKLTEPVGYNLTLKGSTGEGSNIYLLKAAMNYKFNGTGYKVVATNIGGYAGMMHAGCRYNITYTSPTGHVTTLTDQSINGLTNPDNGAFAYWFGNTVNSPFGF